MRAPACLEPSLKSEIWNLRGAGNENSSVFLQVLILVSSVGKFHAPMSFANSDTDLQLRFISPVFNFSPSVLFVLGSSKPQLWEISQHWSRHGLTAAFILYHSMDLFVGLLIKKPDNPSTSTPTRTYSCRTFPQLHSTHQCFSQL